MTQVLREPKLKIDFKNLSLGTANWFPNHPDLMQREKQGAG